MPLRSSPRTRRKARLEGFQTVWIIAVRVRAYRGSESFIHKINIIASALVQVDEASDFGRSMISLMPTIPVTKQH
jgi:hypothetical protein